jgi:hypothetical protein
MAPVVRRRARQLICKPRSIEAERSKRLRGITSGDAPTRVAVLASSSLR